MAMFDAARLLDEQFPLPLDRPFSRRTAHACGLTRWQLERLVRDGYLRRVLRGVFVAGQCPDDLVTRARALALVVPDAGVIVDWTACWLYTGVLDFGSHLEVPPVSVFLPSGHGRLRNGLSVSGERRFGGDDVHDVAGLRVTTPVRTAWDLGRLSRRDQALAGLDCLLRTGEFERAELLDGIERFRRQRGVVQLRALAPLADGRAESPGESVLRLRWLDLPSLPRPEPQVRVYDERGVEIYRVDLGVRELLFGMEYDGAEHHTAPIDRAHDVRRREELGRRWGWDVHGVNRANVFGARRDIEVQLHRRVAQARRTLGRRRPV